MMAKTVAYLSPSTLEDIMQLNNWRRAEYYGLNFNISMSMAYTLYMNGTQGDMIP